MLHSTESEVTAPTEAYSRTPSTSEAVRAEEEILAPRLDTEVEELTAYMEASAARSKRGARTRNRIGISVSLACIGSIAAWIYAVVKGLLSLDTMPMAVTVIMGMIPMAVFIGLFVWFLKDHRFRQEPDVVKRLMLRDDVRVVGPLLDAYTLYPASRVSALLQAMGHLLPRMTEDEIRQLGKERHGRLATWVAGWEGALNRKMFAEAGTPFLLQLIVVMAQIGESSFQVSVSPRLTVDVPVLPTLEKWATGQGVGHDPVVQQAAAACRDAIRQNMAPARSSEQLLRASAPTPANSDTLLRPAQGASQTDPAELLRPSDPE